MCLILYQSASHHHTAYKIIGLDFSCDYFKKGKNGGTTVETMALEQWKLKPRLANFHCNPKVFFFLKKTFNTLILMKHQSPIRGGGS